MIYYKLRQTSPSNESGFTIIESLVAILVAAILLAAIAPVIVISVATRVQAKRIERASDAAKSYLDGIQTGIITPPAVTGGSYTITTYPAPTIGSLTCSTTDSSYPYCSVPTPANSLYCVDVDGGGCTNSSSVDFVIQAFRYNKVSSSTADNGYQLGLRVYRADGFASDGGNLKTAPNKQATFTGGVGDRKTPLVEMTTEISNENTKFSDFCDRLEDTGNTASSCK
ncbi:hormogonium polysaccharide secretion pseudopilin HpsB [Nostoc sp. UHCC 0870]|uniref:hormogonium polysaccharide secretion pseudopilin HpsB n=1 Tax=Nostoc sp. UHCC 0870 TaxID=2914041 RepID=UPI001EE02EDA|nr:hormogonium polysaccharide secretion pseudopilin HpsB [Nostoc sp. UHCC 0870]UKO97150.1 hormogonium polysaccharide secretion pseudopilin HpsB [Nostoc sp. UHCC 0870]